MATNGRYVGKFLSLSLEEEHSEFSSLVFVRERRDTFIGENKYFMVHELYLIQLVIRIATYSLFV